eukprot:CAMPEP_0172364984 /NCGR_PEP_ID=MMETSP1060-20121228/7995_1 /TAXON_ID=37318 /ORGANISM="Pseudo-nitzschia pungens, Strain cf. cingulata" /LENGTH=103 /DNA_ID=CAMNT_0013088129 /DNA_START=67 /DNA_END=378 /DNA_ORIENTATION=-
MTSEIEKAVPARTAYPIMISTQHSTAGSILMIDTPFLSFLQNGGPEETKEEDNSTNNGARHDEKTKQKLAPPTKEKRSLSPIRRKKKTSFTPRHSFVEKAVVC